MGIHVNKDLKDYMRKAGEVTYADAHKIRQNEGVVEFASSSDMKTAIEKLDGTELHGRKIKLTHDKGHGGSSKRRSRSRSHRSDSRDSRSYSRSRSARSSRSRSKDRRSKSKSRERSRSDSRDNNVKDHVRHHSKSRSQSYDGKERGGGGASKDYVANDRYENDDDAE